MPAFKFWKHNRVYVALTGWPGTYCVDETGPESIDHRIWQNAILLIKQSSHHSPCFKYSIVISFKNYLVFLQSFLSDT